MIGDGVPTDAQIAAMSATERRDLIQRLERPIDDLVARPVAARIRRIRLGLMIAGAIGLIPWIEYLALSLPTSYDARHWSVTWVGFDVVLVALMAATAVFGLLRRQLLIITGPATAVLLMCDAWFDLMTVQPDDRWMSIVSAAVELPLAVLLITGTVRILRLTAIRLWLPDAATPLWRLPLFA
ncbi:hypothetical protein [Mycolicibacterium hodleri]|uniref:hypothetical protein n=1 Tax=Mycolicibacterium hodleri TaxID=49897 RepID=UPI001F416AE5|nr:hypothetical protein [Mycolicibacterium hodleri]